MNLENYRMYNEKNDDTDGDIVLINEEGCVMLSKLDMTEVNIGEVCNIVKYEVNEVVGKEENEETMIVMECLNCGCRAEPNCTIELEVLSNQLARKSTQVEIMSEELAQKTTQVERLMLLLQINNIKD